MNNAPIDEQGFGDLRIEYSAKDLNTLFTEVTRQFSLALVNPKHLQATLQHIIQLESSSLQQLLLDWLDELIFLKDRDGFVAKKCTIQIDEQQSSLRATLSGENIDVHRHELRHDIKAVTLHDFILKHTNTTWYTHIILDL